MLDAGKDIFHLQVPHVSLQHWQNEWENRLPFFHNCYISQTIYNMVPKNNILSYMVQYKGVANERSLNQSEEKFKVYQKHSHSFKQEFLLDMSLQNKDGPYYSVYLLYSIFLSSLSQYYLKISKLKLGCHL